jgi:hypothetical protein
MKATNPTTASAWLWIAGTFIFVLAATMLPTVGWVFAAPAVSLAIGAAAAWWVRSTPGASATQATMSGAIAGLGALAASVAAFAVYGWLFGNDPAIQEWIRNSEPSAEAHIPYDWIAPLAASAGIFVGIAAGLINLALAAIGGLFVGLSVPHGRTQVPAHSVPR